MVEGDAPKPASTPKANWDPRMVADLKVKLMHMKKGLFALRQELRSRSLLWDAALQDIEQLEIMASCAKENLKKQKQAARRKKGAQSLTDKDKEGGKEKEKETDKDKEKEVENDTEKDKGKENEIEKEKEIEIGKEVEKEMKETKDTKETKETETNEKETPNDEKNSVRKDET